MRPPLCASCSSGQRFACGFLQIPSHDRHPCRPANDSSYQARLELSSYRNTACWTYHYKARPKIPVGLYFMTQSPLLVLFLFRPLVFFEITFVFFAFFLMFLLHCCICFILFRRQNSRYLLVCFFLKRHHFLFTGLEDGFDLRSLLIAQRQFLSQALHPLFAPMSLIFHWVSILIGKHRRGQKQR